MGHGSIAATAERIAGLRHQKALIDAEAENARKAHQELRRREALGEKVKPSEIRELRLRIADLADRAGGIEDALDTLQEELHQAEASALEAVEAKIREMQGLIEQVQARAFPEVVKAVGRLIELTGATIQGGTVAQISLPLWVKPRELRMAMAELGVKPPEGSPPAHATALEALYREKDALQSGTKARQYLREAGARATAG